MEAVGAWHQQQAWTPEYASAVFLPLCGAVAQRAPTHRRDPSGGAQEGGDRGAARKGWSYVEHGCQTFYSDRTAC